VIEIMIDPNVRVAGGLTFSGFEDVRGAMPAEGQQVLVREPEANLIAVGVVDHVDTVDELVYIAVDWTQLAPDNLPTPGELVGRLQRTLAARQPLARQLADSAQLIA
jgi:hypothetical protein